jgi:16S rRNA processing protein RimM
VGRIRAAHGLKGEVSVKNLSDFPARFAPGSLLYLWNPSGDPLPLRIEKSSRHKQLSIIKLEGVATRTEAEAFRGRELLVPRQAVGPISFNQYYLFHLIGCRVVDVLAGDLGTVAQVVETPGGALLQVEGPAGETLIPMVEGIILELDVTSGVIRVDLPEGLVGLNS